MTLTATDLFCGAGGSSLGAEMAGVNLVMAANHWPTAIDVHQANFPNARHDCADISQVDPRRYPTTDLLLASPECTNHTAAKGISRRAQDASLFDSPDLGAERSRATMWDVHRFVEYHQYAACIIENVVEATRWVYWPSWCRAWDDAGYDVKTLSINSAHTGQVPQWRDRIYVVATRRGLRLDLEFRPPSWCPTCEKIVDGVQAFKRHEVIAGRWRQQYHYRCPDCAGIVDPPAPPAASAIDWSHRGQRIGDRKRPLAAKTYARVQRALDLYGTSLVAVAGNTYERPGYTRAWPVDGSAPTQTTTMQHAVLVPMRKHTRPTTTDEPAFTVSAGGNHHGLLMAPQSGGEGRPTDVPSPALATKASPLLITYNRNGEARPVSEPATTVTTRDRHALLQPSLHADDAELRMLQPPEQGALMAFPADYDMGDTTKTEQTKLYGNGVTPPVMTHPVGRIVAALGRSTYD